MIPSISIFTQYFWSSMSFLNAGTSDNIKVLSPSICSVFSFSMSKQQLLLIIYLWPGTAFALLVWTQRSIYWCAAACTLFILLSFINIFFLIAACHWGIEKVARSCILGSRNYIWYFFYGSTALYGHGPPRFVEVSWSHKPETHHSR